MTGVYMVLTELAQTYETMGQFRESEIVSEQILALTSPPLHGYGSE